MGTEVLRPHDCLNQRLGVVSPAVFPRRKVFNGNNRNINRKQPQPVRTSPDRSKQPISRRSSSSDDLKSTKNNLDVGQVTILRRGESLDSKLKSIKDKEDEYCTRSGSEKMMMYAGTTTFGMSPSPNSLPVPSFSKKVQVQVQVRVSPVVVDLATRDLRRLLRID